MRRFIEGADRQQSTLFQECLEDWICEEPFEKGPPLIKARGRRNRDRDRRGPTTGAWAPGGATSGVWTAGGTTTVGGGVQRAPQRPARWGKQSRLPSRRLHGRCTSYFQPQWSSRRSAVYRPRDMGLASIMMLLASRLRTSKGWMKAHRNPVGSFGARLAAPTQSRA